MTPVLGTGEQTMRQSRLQERLDELFRETEGDLVDVLSGRVTVKESRARQRELGKRLKALEQEFKKDGWAEVISESVLDTPWKLPTTVWAGWGRRSGSRPIAVETRSR
jgi:hypothetical protein